MRDFIFVNCSLGHIFILKKTSIIRLLDIIIECLMKLFCSIFVEMCASEFRLICCSVFSFVIYSHLKHQSSFKVIRNILFLTLFLNLSVTVTLLYLTDLFLFQLGEWTDHSDWHHNVLMLILLI
jgi:hypothetical protein